MRRFFILSSMVLIWSSIGSAEIIYVKSLQDSSDAWLQRNPVYSSIQFAVNLANSGDEIWVAKGTYFESLVLKSDIKLIGGFNGNENSISERILWNLKPASIIDAGGANRCILADSNTTIDGFTLKSGGNVDRGAGIYINNETNIEIKNMFIEYCSVSWLGGGIYIETNKRGTISIERIVIWNCNSYCGVLEMDERSLSTLRVKNCTIVDNDSYGIELPLHEEYDSNGKLVPVQPRVWDHLLINTIAWDNINPYNSHAPKSEYNTHDVWSWAREFLDYSYVGKNAWEDASMENKWHSPKPNNRFEKEFDWLGAPGFVDPAHGDFRLLPDSPCLDAGMDGADLGAYPSNDVSVQVLYYHTQNTVPKVQINLTDNLDDSHLDLTNKNGNCFFTNIINGKTAFMPTKANDQNDAIAGSDALLILQYLAFLTSLTDDQQVAADVTADRSLSGSDAQAILRYLAFYTNNAGNTGNWIFAPDTSIFIIQSDTTARFKAYLLGDVSGNWSANSGLTSNLKNNDLTCLLRLDNIFVDSEQVIKIPIRIESLTQPLHTIIFTLEYDPKILTYQNTEPSDSCRNFMMAANGNELGKVHLAMASVQGITLDNDLGEIVFQLSNLSVASSESELRISRALINDIPVDQIQNAKIYFKNHSQTVDAATQFSFDNHPNPFNLTTTISFRMPEEAYITLSIFNLQGQLIAKLLDEKMMAGNHQIDWTAKTPDGNSLPAGIYFCRVEIAAASKNQNLLRYSTKMFLLK